MTKRGCTWSSSVDDTHESFFQNRGPVKQQCLGAVPARRYSAEPRVACHSRGPRNAWLGCAERSIGKQGGYSVRGRTKCVGGAPCAQSACPLPCGRPTEPCRATVGFRRAPWGSVVLDGASQGSARLRQAPLGVVGHRRAP